MSAAIMSKLIVFDGQSCPKPSSVSKGETKKLLPGTSVHTILINLPVLQGAVFPAANPGGVMHIANVTIDC
jgi:hypothetical protein